MIYSAHPSNSESMPNPPVSFLTHSDVPTPEKSSFKGRTYQVHSAESLSVPSTKESAFEPSNAFYACIKTNSSKPNPQKSILPSIKPAQPLLISSYPTLDRNERDSFTELDKRFHIELDEWTAKFKQILLDCDEESEKHKFLLNFSKNIHLIGEEFQAVCQSILSTKDSHLIWEYLDTMHEGMKLFKPLDHAALNAARWFMIHQAKKELNQIYLKYPKTTDEKRALERQKRFDQCFKQLEEAREKAQRNCTSQLTKLAAHQILPHFLSSTLGLLPKAIKKCCKLVSDIQNNMTSVSNFSKAFYLQEEWIQQLQQKEVEANPANIQALLRKREEKFNRCIYGSLIKLDPLFASCVHLSFEEINVKLKQHHMDLEGLEGAPRNKMEWDEQIADRGGLLRLSLSSQWVSYQQAAAQLAEQGARASLLAKIQAEKKLLAFRGIEQVIAAVLIGLKIALYLPSTCIYVERYCLNYLVSNLPLPGLGLLAILSSERNITVDALFTAALAFCVGAYYKPHEYNREGYRLYFYLQWSKFKAQLAYYHYRVKQLLLTLQIRLIENCVLRIKNESQEGDCRFDKLKDCLALYVQNNQAYQDALNKQLDNLKLKDINCLIQPQSIPGPYGEENYTPLKQLIEALQEIDLDCISDSTKYFFQEHLGIDLEQDQKHLKSKLEHFFIKSESEFLKHFEENRHGLGSS